jgi:hypothetical protein
MPRYQFVAGHPHLTELMTGNTRTLFAEDDGYKCALEVGFPRVLQAIEALWGFGELNDYFRKLMIDERGDRDGFPPEAWEEIDLLQHIHEELFPDRNF